MIVGAELQAERVQAGQRIVQTLLRAGALRRWILLCRVWGFVKRKGGKAVSQFEIVNEKNAGEQNASSPFLKKRTKKLLLPFAFAGVKSL